jgi:transketolase
VLWDDNRHHHRWRYSLSTSEDIPARYAATGWHTVAATGMTLPILSARWPKPLADPRPSLVACKTIIGKGAPNKQGGHSVHGSPLGADEIAARASAGLERRRSKCPPTSRRLAYAWCTRKRGGSRRMGSAAGRIARTGDFEARMAGDLPAGALEGYIAGLIAAPQKVATRKASEMALGRSPPRCRDLVGGSADLTGSNNTKTKATGRFTGGLCRALCLLRHPRIRHGRGDERHGAAWRRHSLWRHLPGVFRLLPQRHPPVRLIQHARVVYVLTHDSASAWARTARPTSRSSMS